MLGRCLRGLNTNVCARGRAYRGLIAAPSSYRTSFALYPTHRSRCLFTESTDRAHGSTVILSFAQDITRIKRRIDVVKTVPGIQRKTFTKLLWYLVFGVLFWYNSSCEIMIFSRKGLTYMQQLDKQSRAEQDNSALFCCPNIKLKRSHRFAVWERFLCLFDPSPPQSAA